MICNQSYLSVFNVWKMESFTNNSLKKELQSIIFLYSVIFSFSSDLIINILMSDGKCNVSESKLGNPVTLDESCL